MLLPTRGVSAERALMTVGSDLLEALQTPKSVSSLWDHYKAHDRATGSTDHVTFDWFSLALASLFAINVLEWAPSGHLRRLSVH